MKKHGPNAHALSPPNWPMSLFDICISGVLTVFCNLLLLVGPLFMLQVYDRVLSSRSQETLIGLACIAVFLLLVWGVLEYCRTRLLSLCGLRWKAAWDRFLALRNHGIVTRRGADHMGSLITAVDRVEDVFTSAAMAAVLDVFWVPIFLLALALFHPALSLVAGMGVLGLIIAHFGMTLAARRPQDSTRQYAQEAVQLASHLSQEGWRERGTQNWHNKWQAWGQTRDHCLVTQNTSLSRLSAFQSATKAAKLVLQVILIAVGGFFVLQDEMSVGALVAATILLARVLAPVELLCAQFAHLQNAWRSLALLREAQSIADDPIETTAPATAQVVCENLRLTVRDEQGISFSISGETLGVIGAQGSGKHALLCALIGANTAAQGMVNLGGTPIGRYMPHLGLSHVMSVFPDQSAIGTVAQAITGFQETPDHANLTRAISQAGLSQEIACLPFGWHTQVADIGPDGEPHLRHQIAVAAAYYQNPQVLIWDQADESPALATLLAHRNSDKRATILSSPRPIALEQCSKLLWLENARCRAFGSRDAVLAQYFRPATPSQGATKLGLVS